MCKNTYIRLSGIPHFLPFHFFVLSWPLSTSITPEKTKVFIFVERVENCLKKLIEI